MCGRQGDVLLGQPSHQQERRAQVRSKGGQVPRVDKLEREGQRVG